MAWIMPHTCTHQHLLAKQISHKQGHIDVYTLYPNSTYAMYFEANLLISYLSYGPSYFVPEWYKCNAFFQFSQSLYPLPKHQLSIFCIKSIAILVSKLYKSTILCM